MTTPVARAAVIEARRVGRVVQPSLKGGIVAPVSRPNVTALKESGWF